MKIQYAWYVCLSKVLFIPKFTEAQNNIPKQSTTMQQFLLKLVTYQNTSHTHTLTSNSVSYSPLGISMTPVSLNSPARCTYRQAVLSPKCLPSATTSTWYFMAGNKNTSIGSKGVARESNQPQMEIPPWQWRQLRLLSFLAQINQVTLTSLMKLLLACSYFLV